MYMLRGRAATPGKRDASLVSLGAAPRVKP
jgi:hypothetical protein